MSCNTPFFPFRYLNPVETNFYHGGSSHLETRQQSSGPSNSDIHSLLQSMCCSLSDVQRQLVATQEREQERDSSIKTLIAEVQELKDQHASLHTVQAPKSKRCRKSPRGLSVRATSFFLRPS